MTLGFLQLYAVVRNCNHVPSLCLWSTVIYLLERSGERFCYLNFYTLISGDSRVEKEEGVSHYKWDLL